MPLEFIALLAAGLLAGTVCLHIALATGRPFGQFAWGGSEKILSPQRRRASAISAIVLIAFAWVILIHGGIFERVAPVGWTRVALWIFAAQFALNTFANLMSKRAPERLVMGSVTTVLTACCVTLAWFV